jgi:hypothetical protein
MRLNLVAEVEGHAWHRCRRKAGFTHDRPVVFRENLRHSVHRFYASQSPLLLSYPLELVSVQVLFLSRFCIPGTYFSPAAVGFLRWFRLSHARTALIRRLEI